MRPQVSIALAQVPPTPAWMIAHPGSSSVFFQSLPRQSILHVVGEVFLKVKRGPVTSQGKISVDSSMPESRDQTVWVSVRSPGIHLQAHWAHHNSELLLNPLLCWKCPSPQGEILWDLEGPALKSRELLMAVPLHRGLARGSLHGAQQGA